MLRLTNKIPGLRNIGFLKKYSDYLYKSGFKIDALLWITFSLLISLISALVLFIIIPSQGFIAFLVFIVIADLTIGYPYFMAMNRISKIEENLPDALRQMADTLKAGGTYEYALREVASSEYGPLKDEMNNVLRKLEEGENFENSLNSLSERVDSRLVKRTVTIIIDSLRAGAGLATILEQIAEDVRSVHQINRERISRTLLQVIFTAFAGSVVAPAIFGFVSTIINLLLSSARLAELDPTKIQSAAVAGDIIMISITIYIFIEVLASSAMISLMRSGKLTKSIIYFPFLLFTAYVCFILAQILSQTLVG
jgi:pilus assembly protein TadC